MWGEKLYPWDKDINSQHFVQGKCLSPYIRKDFASWYCFNLPSSEKTYVFPHEVVIPVRTKKTSLIWWQTKCKKTGGTGETGYHQPPSDRWTATTSPRTTWHIDPHSKCLHSSPPPPTVARLPSGPQIPRCSLFLQSCFCWRHRREYERKSSALTPGTSTADTWFSNLFFLNLAVMPRFLSVTSSCMAAGLATPHGNMEGLMTGGTRKSKKSASCEGMLEPLDVHRDLSLLQVSEIHCLTLKPWGPTTTAR